MAISDTDATKGPVHWPTLTAEEASHEWPALLAWVNEFEERYPNGVRVPECWWRHHDLVEALSALRDHERVSFARNSLASAAVEWQRARRDVEAALDQWIKRLPCAVPGRGHRPPDKQPTEPAGWADHVESDVRRRAAHDELD